ncbi:MAG: hypothetical protein JST30_02890 [Armatimonadetes bacterium]|nr:hypothetical protein [Armatimonadota bacterium]
MTASLKRLLGRSIDYAGLFPPAGLGMSDAVKEYKRHLESENAWIVDSFVCNASRLAELASELKGHPGTVLEVSVVGSPLEGDAAARIRHDVIEMQESSNRGQMTLVAYEAKLTSPESRSSGLAALKKLPGLVGLPELPLYAEIGWDEGLVDTMHEAASSLEDVAFKARTGGVRAEAFPSSENLAGFISECAALEAPFKFTAGLHDPVRHPDPELGTDRHGFVNVMMAGALAVTQDLSRREIQSILDTEDAGAFSFDDTSARVAGRTLSERDIEDFLGVFGGFGSCSVEEPIDGLRALGWTEGGAA